ncbi:MAG: hypothetical protein H6714_00710 [Myxococcales bacterium]|nr:hypothetical protein [Myxococcales bacterium]
MKEVGDPLAGRADILELETLSRAELSAANLEAPLKEHMLKGGLPSMPICHPKAKA